MRGLKICLWMGAIGCLASVVGLVLPLSVWEGIVDAFGIESLPDSPLFMYVARLLSAMSAATGVFLIILALDPLKYGVLIPFTALSAICLGVVCSVAGAVTPMPVWWYLGDSVSCLAFGALTLVFWQQARQITPMAV